VSKEITNFLAAALCQKCKNAIWRSPIYPPNGFITKGQADALRREESCSYSFESWFLRCDCLIERSMIVLGWTTCSKFEEYLGKDASHEERSAADAQAWIKETAQLADGER